jgi:hypothetical protein
VFPCRIGFSGTPSDLLPMEMGRCAFERGDDGRIVHTLTSPSAMRVAIVAAGWTVGSLLRRVATSQPPFHALIGERASPVRRDPCQCTEACVQVGGIVIEMFTTVCWECGDGHAPHSKSGDCAMRLQTLARSSLACPTSR